jgi:hypothetical protein
LGETVAVRAQKVHDADDFLIPASHDVSPLVHDM